MTNTDLSRRGALRCMGIGAGTLFSLSGGILTASSITSAMAADGKPLFVQISDTHIGFNAPANKDVNGTFTTAISRINAMPTKPGLILHTGDITHLSKPAEFDMDAHRARRA